VTGSKDRAAGDDDGRHAEQSIMDLTGIIVFALALLVAAVSPGPGIAAILARVLGRGPNGAVAFTAGMAIGDVVWLSCAIVGLAALAQSFYGVFVAIKWAGIAYLVHLAVRARRLFTSPRAIRILNRTSGAAMAGAAVAVATR
jgi:threonine/homoserine/homoserine lactone efflux protein